VKNPTAAKRSLVGTWRIVAMELWSSDDVDLLGPAHLTLDRWARRLSAIVEGKTKKVVPIRA